MRELTFMGFLKKYLKELSYCSSNSFFKLSKEAESQNPRLREPLLVYVFLSIEKDKFMRILSKYNWFQKDNFYFKNYQEPTSLLNDLENEGSNLPTEYKKVYKTYLNLRNRTVHGMHTKELMWNKITKLKSEKNISTYRLYKDLFLNHGNVNDFVKNKKLDKLSLENSKKVLNYLESYNSNKENHIDNHNRIF